MPFRKEIIVIVRTTAKIGNIKDCAVIGHQIANPEGIGWHMCRNQQWITIMNGKTHLFSSDQFGGHINIIDVMKFALLLIFKF